VVVVVVVVFSVVVVVVSRLSGAERFPRAQPMEK
jgi:hypothetical protein